MRPCMLFVDAPPHADTTAAATPSSTLKAPPLPRPATQHTAHSTQHTAHSTQHTCTATSMATPWGTPRMSSSATELTALPMVSCRSGTDTILMVASSSHVSVCVSLMRMGPAPALSVCARARQAAAQWRVHGGRGVRAGVGGLHAAAATDATGSTSGASNEAPHTHTPHAHQPCAARWPGGSSRA
jgi:hypothetical protein